ncbi:MAG: hypothetical protein NUV56_03285 [Candidatus Uhrbacteria bacterium]|nr:hypothetical protein [Candidatus Uhrbacteria bacterium]
MTPIATYANHGRVQDERLALLLKHAGHEGMPTSYATYLGIDHWLREQIGFSMPLIQSDNYEHFMGCLPGKGFGAHHVLIRKQIGGFTVAAGFWRWLEFLSRRVTHDQITLVADYMSGKHNGFPRQFNEAYWRHVVDDCGGYLPLRIEYVGEGAVFTGVPFPIAQVMGERNAIWLNEPMYIQIGHTTRIATIAAQFAEVLGDPYRFIEVAFRAMHNGAESRDLLLAMLIGGGIISSSNDLGCFMNGGPFKAAGTTGHCFFQQWETLKEALRALLSSPLGPYATVLLDLIDHKDGFKDLLELVDEGLPAPFAERPDSGDVVTQGIEDLTILGDRGKDINVVFEDGKRPKDVLDAEKRIRMMGLDAKRAISGGGGVFMGPRRDLETAYKACAFWDGSYHGDREFIDTMKYCFDDPMKMSIPGLISWHYSEERGVFMLGTYEQDTTLPGFKREQRVLYDNIINPGSPYFDPAYSPQDLTSCQAVIEGQARSLAMRKRLGPNFCLDVEPNRNAMTLTRELRAKQQRMVDAAKRQRRG